MIEETNIISNLITVSPVVGVLIYFIIYFKKVIAEYKAEILIKDETIQRLNDQGRSEALEIMSMGKDINVTLEKLIEKITD